MESLKMDRGCGSRGASTQAHVGLAIERRYCPPENVASSYR
jgi:hypothetical protein